MYDIFWYDYDDCSDIKTLVEFARSFAQTEYVWLCHRSVDYRDFNYHYIPPKHQKDFFHAWASHDNKNCYTTWLIKSDKIWSNTDCVFHDVILPILKPVHGTLWKWVTDDKIDYQDFNFNWFPDVWDWHMSHEFTMRGTERLSYTRLTNGSNDLKYHWAGLTYGQKYYEVCLLDTGMNNPHPHDFKIRLITTIDDAIKTAVKRCTQPWLWIIADCCDYTDFDFNYLPEVEQQNDIHCWPSYSCEHGETFLIYIPAYLNDAYKWNFNHRSVKRLPWPVIEYDGDSITQAVKDNPPSAIYTIYKQVGREIIDIPTVSLWDKRPVVGLNFSNSVSIVPRDFIPNEEVYEYPYLLTFQYFATDRSVDVIFISNGESVAEKNYNRLLEVSDDKNVKRSSDIVGRLNSYKAAAKLSSTPWFIAIFAKCWMRDEFATMTWYPDYWQKPKHYIFHNFNHNNNLTYGHMAPIAYNKKLMLENTGGLDMTLVQDHTIVPLCISNTFTENDPWLTWRTAFREVIKLLHYSKDNTSVENEYRLYCWKHNAYGKDALWQRRAYDDAVEFYKTTSEENLILTNEWAWLREYFNIRYNDEITV